ncbi:MAG: hypothetical protein BIFFINMI_00515 [Phycisphaerae bacterium]|nr:hypothetical protein [Phycisphaerae bacterium]
MRRSPRTQVGLAIALLAAPLAMLVVAGIVGCEQQAQPEAVQPAPSSDTLPGDIYFTPQRPLTVAEQAALRPAPASRPVQPIEMRPARPARAPASPTTQPQAGPEAELPLVPVKPLTAGQRQELTPLMKRLNQEYLAIADRLRVHEQPLLSVNTQRLNTAVDQVIIFANREGDRLDVRFPGDLRQLASSVETWGRVPPEWSREQVRPAVVAVADACNRCHLRYPATPPVGR